MIDAPEKVPHADEMSRKEKVALAVKMADEDNLSYIEIAERLGVKPPTASAYLRDGRGAGRRGFPRASDTPERMSIRVTPDMFRRFDLVLEAERKQDRKRTQRSIIEDALGEYFDRHHPELT